MCQMKSLLYTTKDIINLKHLCDALVSFRYIQTQNINSKRTTAKH